MKISVLSGKMKDYCTLFPEGNWSKCCALHDRRYENKRLTKYQADKLLFRCVRRKGNNIIASIMFAGVTIFGHYSYFKAKKAIR